VRATIIYRWKVRLAALGVPDVVVDAELADITQSGVLFFRNGPELVYAFGVNAWVDLERCQVVSDQ
jgi:hypothetical protein